ncbi:MAG: hypothetical protein A3F84_05535 [Candidatus Handelsmanbacteria bacterium RIFCSPLOWO2_12_FULL_64_10]|uniref:AAA domain-containing protein n=1 Tax=Handelsmanbacteria sp. (strain RIFCSPLOWO2_12_FULL_64_10) TaxID=1817868 RepID=A0A1F6C686_HANXR|nr:MAG: hypothetical protein A3F84_05535 [Candidatus Handelsmanbacteria bacterium RIFCSPLOWO2_12_FULL_64_10]
MAELDRVEGRECVVEQQIRALRALQALYGHPLWRRVIVNPAQNPSQLYTPRKAFEAHLAEAGFRDALKAASQIAASFALPLKRPRFDEGVIDEVLAFELPGAQGREDRNGRVERFDRETVERIEGFVEAEEVKQLLRNSGARLGAFVPSIEMIARIYLGLKKGYDLNYAARREIQKKIIFKYQKAQYPEQAARKACHLALRYYFAHLVDDNGSDLCEGRKAALETMKKMDVDLEGRIFESLRNACRALASERASMVTLSAEWEGRIRGATGDRETGGETALENQFVVTDGNGLANAQASSHRPGAHPEAHPMEPQLISSAEERLPFDPRTLLLGLWRRWPTLAAFVFVSCLLGVVCGVTLGSRTYESETVLLHRPTEGLSPSLLTQMNMVKIQPNLSEVRRRLKLTYTLESIGEVCDVRVQENTNMMIIRAAWNSAEGAADLANTVRDVFVENQQRMQKADVGEQIRDLEEHLEAVRRRLETADATLQEFTGTQKFAGAQKAGDLDLEAQGYLQQLASLDRLYERAKVEKETVGARGENLDHFLNGLDRGVVDGPAPSRDLEGFVGMNVRLQGLLNAIQEDRSHRANLAELSQREKEFEIARKLKERGFISEDAYQKAFAAYERQKALTVDTERIGAWREEAAKLMRERVERLEQARQKVKAKLDVLPQQQRQYVALRREATFWEGEMEGLEERLAQARRAYESRLSDFSIVSKAEVPPLPSHSNRRILAAGVASLGSLLGLALILVLELLDTRIKSGAELSLKLPLPVLGVLPRLSPDQPLFPGKEASELVEPFKVAAHHIRRAVPKKGARILVVSARHGEGATLTATNLAGCFGRQEERVLLVDAQLRSREDRGVISDLIREDGGSLKGLGAYLSSETDQLQDVVWPTALPGVECLSHAGETVNPDRIGSRRMRQLLEEASERFSLVLIDAPPALLYADADSLAPWVDGIVFVIQSRACPLSALKKALDRLRSSGAPVVGAILNRVDPLYLE